MFFYVQLLFHLIRLVDLFRQLLRIIPYLLRISPVIFILKIFFLIDQKIQPGSCASDGSPDRCHADSTHKEDGKKKKQRYTVAERRELIAKYTKEMKAAAKLLEFEHAAYLRDKIKELEASTPPAGKKRVPRPRS